MLACHDSLALRVQYDRLCSIDDDRRPKNSVPNIKAIKLVYGSIDTPVGFGEVDTVR